MGPARGILALLALTLLSCAKPSADEDFAGLKALRSEELRAQALKFYASHPRDSRRWDAIAMTVMANPKETPQWVRERESITAEALRATDISEASLARLVFKAIERDSVRLNDAVEKGLASMQSRLAVLDKRGLHAQKQSAWVANSYMLYAQSIEPFDPAARIALLKRLSGTENPRLASWATGQLNLEAAKQPSGASQPLDFEFTAIDGRNVSFAALRGKVVLVDFWALWCAPCIEELPSLKKTYEAHRAQGFEIVGITVDDIKERQKYLDFLAQHEVSWPQQFDGKGFKTELAARFGVSGLPTPILLDRSGRVVSTRARGEELETLLRRYL